MTKQEAMTLAQALMACHQQDVRPSRLARLLMDAAVHEARNDDDPRDAQGRVLRRRPRGTDWRETALAWLGQQPQRKATIREYAAAAELRRATAYARLMALCEDGLAEAVAPGVYRAL